MRRENLTMESEGPAEHGRPDAVALSGTDAVFGPTSDTPEWTAGPCRGCTHGAYLHFQK